MFTVCHPWNVFSLLELLLYSALSHKETVLTTTKMRNNVTLLSRANSDLVFENFATSAKPRGMSVLLAQFMFHQTSAWCYSKLFYCSIAGTVASPGLIHLHIGFQEDSVINKRRGLYPPGFITRVERALRRFFGTS